MIGRCWRILSKLFLAFVFAAFAMGCDSQISDFVGSANRKRPNNSITPSTPGSNTPAELSAKLLSDLGTPSTWFYYAILGGNKMVYVGGAMDSGMEPWILDMPTQTTQLLKDLYSGATSSNPHAFRESQGKVYFTAEDSTGRQLWVTDGSASGTIRLTSFTNAALTISSIIYPTATGVIFFPDDVTYGIEPWVSNGTVVGTTLLLDIFPSTNSSPNGGIAEAGGTYFFTATDGTTGYELWKTNGTAGNASQVLDIYSGAAGSIPDNITTFGSKVIFTATTAAAGSEPWISDGSAGGTFILKDIRAGGTGSSINSFTVRGAQAYFVARDAGGLYQLWATDGTALNTVKIGTANISPFPYYIRIEGDKIFYSGSSGAFTGIWMYDITNSTETFLSATTGFDYWTGTYKMGNELFFVSNTVANGSELTKINLTTFAVSLVKDITPGATSANVASMTYLDATHFTFIASSPTTGYEVWISDGTGAGTTVVKEISAGAYNTSFSAGTLIPYAAGNKVFFPATPRGGVSTMWVSDGTAPNTNPIASSPRTGSVIAGTPLLFLATLGNRIVGTGMPENTRSLFSLDLTTDSTVKIRNGEGVSGGASIYHMYKFLEFNNKIYFNWEDSVQGEVLGVSDGTEAGTVILTDPNSGSTNSGGMAYFFFGKDANQFYFRAYDPVNGAELWKSNGTVGGTSLVKNIAAGATGISPTGEGVLVNSNFLFCIDDLVSGREIWVTDGTSGGTNLLKDIYVGAQAGLSSVGLQGAQAGGFHYFSAGDATTGWELWRTDGTSGGTTLVKDIDGAVSSANPINFMAFGNKVFFTATVTGMGGELWISDGTGPGTTLVKDINSGATGSSIMPMGIVTSGSTKRYVFVANDGVSGAELWVSDGTPSGTVLLKDIYPGATSSMPVLMPYLVVGNYAYFIANDGQHGNEIWRTDGTVAGTKLYYETLPGSAARQIYNLHTANGKIYYTAVSAYGSWEVYSLDIQ